MNATNHTQLAVHVKLLYRIIYCIVSYEAVIIHDILAILTQNCSATNGQRDSNTEK